MMKKITSSMQAPKSPKGDLKGSLFVTVVFASVSEANSQAQKYTVNYKFAFLRSVDCFVNSQ